MNNGNNFEEKISAEDKKLESQYPLNKRVWQVIKNYILIQLKLVQT